MERIAGDADLARLIVCAWPQDVRMTRYRWNRVVARWDRGGREILSESQVRRLLRIRPRLSV